MNQNQITPQQALKILDIATQPAFKPVREDFCNIHAALVCLNDFVVANCPKPEAPKVEPAKE